MNELTGIKALDTYYEFANSDFDRMNGYFDQIDAKAGILVAFVAGIPIASLGFAFGLGKGELEIVAAVLGGLGLAAFLAAGFQLVRAVRVREVKFGVPHTELRQHAQTYGEEAVKECIADLLVKSSEHNFSVIQTKVKHLQAVFPFLAVEVLLFLAASAYLLVGKL